MAEAPDSALEPIGAVRRTRWAVRPPSRCARDIRLLGGILGDTVRDQNGPEIFDLVERARVESFRVRRSRSTAPSSRGCSTDRRRHGDSVIRAFTTFALLANVAEDIHRERRRAIHVAAGSRRRTAHWPPPTSRSSTPPASTRRR